MRNSCVNLIILLVNCALKLIQATDNSTIWPLVIDNYQDYSTVLPKPINSTKPTTLKETVNLNNLNDQTFPIGYQQNQNQSKVTKNESSIDQSSFDTLSERGRSSKFLSTTVLPFGTKLNRKPIDINRNQTSTNVDLQTNMTVITGRSSLDKPFDKSFYDESSQSKSNDPYLDDKFLQHLSAYDRIKIKNEKFGYDNFFSLYDVTTQDPDEDEPKSQTSSPTKNPFDEENQTSDQYPFQNLVQYRPANILPLTAQYQQYQQQLQQQYPQQFQLQQQQSAQQYAQPYYSPYDYSMTNALVQPSATTLHKFKKYQKQRIKELLHRPVQEMFAGKFKPDYVPKYMLEAPQRSHQQTGLGELFIVLGPLVILPLLSSFALSTFTTLYVTKSLIAKPASTSARHKQFDSKLLKENNLNQTLFNLPVYRADESLVYHPFNASDFDAQFIRMKSNENKQEIKKSNRKFDSGNSNDDDKKISNDELIDKKSSDQTFDEHKDLEKDKRKDYKSVDDLKDESLRVLKRSKRNLRHELIFKELNLDDQNHLIGKKRVKRWNEVLWTKPKLNSQSPWLPLTKKLLGRQPRNSLHHKLFIVRPTKKVYKKIIMSKVQKIKDDDSIKNQLDKDDHSFNQPSNLLHFAINDAIENGKQPLTDLETISQKSNDFQSAASSPSPTYLNLSTNIETNDFNNFNNDQALTSHQPKLYNLRTTNSPSASLDQQLIKRNSPVSQFGDKSFITTSVESNQPSQQNFKSISSNLPISSSNDKNDTIFQRITLMNPFNAPSFLIDKHHSFGTSNASTQTHSKNTRKLDFNNRDSKKDSWDKDVFDTIPLDDWNEDFANKNYVNKQRENQEISTLNSDLDVVQKYLKQTRPDDSYNDEIIATYLSCNGLLSQNNQCLQRLVCQYVDTNVRMPELEKEVASLIIYAILKNKYIDNEVKQNMRQAAQIAYQQKSGQCSQYQCLRIKPNRT